MIGIARAARKSDLHPVAQGIDSQQVGRTRTYRSADDLAQRKAVGFPIEIAV